MDRIATFRDHRTVRASVIAIVLVASACFSPDIPSGLVACGPRGECPSNLTCSGGLCVGPGGGGPDAPIALADARPDAFAGPDSDNEPPPDARPDGGPQRQLTIVFLGSGGGSVSANGMPCASGCTLAFTPGAEVALTPTAAGNSSFGGWSGACSGTGACMLLLDHDQTVNVTFNLNTVQVTLQTSVTPLGTGSVMLTPAGTACGPGCATFPMGQAVTLTPVPSLGLSFVGWSGGGCDAQTGACTVTLSDTTNVVATFCQFNAVVDTTGADGNLGTCVAPFHTVTKALSVALPGQTVSVRPGTYDAAGGETFPLVVPSGVKLIGDEPSLGNGAVAVKLSGGSFTTELSIAATVVVGKNATLAGFLVVDSFDNPDACGVAALDVNGFAADGAVIRANTITGAIHHGIVVFHGAGVTVSGNFILKNGGDGVQIFASGALLDHNVIIKNGDNGVEVTASADLGGGASPGLNRLACNVHFDLLATNAITVTAENDAWDNAPPVTGCTIGTEDVCAQQSATVVTDGATVAPTCPP
jgi:hypothetical protein